MATASAPCDPKLFSRESIAPAGTLGRDGSTPLVGDSAEIAHVRALVAKMALHDCPVLISGETGTGKEVVAHLIHCQSLRQRKPFMVIDCAAISHTLIESELFGHSRGAFTGADREKRGLLESAADGTCFFDEIGELPITLQGKLLRVLQEREFRPVGSNSTLEITGRAIAATNRNLQDCVRTGTFREDLLYRMNVAEITLPPLRQRKIDIHLLVQHFLELRRHPDQPPIEVPPEVIRHLTNYHWPGNVRELKNTIDRALICGSGAAITVNDLPHRIVYPDSKLEVPDEEIFELSALERRAIYRALRQTFGEKLAAARLLGIGKTTLYRKLREYAEM